jgi:hypothetical protein
VGGEYFVIFINVFYFYFYFLYFGFFFWCYLKRYFIVTTLLLSDYLRDGDPPTPKVFGHLSGNQKVKCMPVRCGTWQLDDDAGVP